MRSYSLPAACVLTACSPESFELEPLAQLELSQIREDAGAQDESFLPTASELPFTHRVECVGAEGCEGNEGYSSVSPEERRERATNRAFKEFEFNRASDVESFKITTREVLERATALVNSGTPEALLKVALRLPEEFFDFSRLRTATDDELQRARIEREEQLAPSQAYARQLIESIGGKYEGRLLLANIVYAEVPADGVAALAEAIDLDGLEMADGVDTDASNGIERRLALVWNEDALQSWTWDGNQGTKNGTSSGPVRIAVVETNAEAYNPLNGGYAGFRETGNATQYRIMIHSRCNPGCSTSAWGTWGTHGSRVAGVALADFEDNQAFDLNPTMSTPTRRRRGGIASESTLLYYHTDSKSGTANAINDAVFQGADIVNMSISAGVYCSNESYSGVKSAIEAATEAGVLVVVSAGNEGDTSNCRVNGYGAIPDSFVVGAIDHVVDRSSLATVPLQQYVDTDPNTIDPWSGGNGPNQLMTVSGASARARMVDVTVTGNTQLTVGDGPIAVDAEAARNGTSYAAPQVAGVAAVLKDWMYSTGTYSAVWRNNPYVLQAFLAVMGDGASGVLGGGQLQTALDENHGFGHLRATFPAFLGNTTYGYHRVTPYYDLESGDEEEFYVGMDSGPEPTQIQGWKLAALVDHNYYGSSPAITFQLRDYCSGSVTPPYSTVMNSVISTHKARLRMTASSMASQYHNRCLWVRFRVASADGPFTLWVSEYAYANAREYHDM